MCLAGGDAFFFLLLLFFFPFFFPSPFPFSVFFALDPPFPPLLSPSPSSAAVLGSSEVGETRGGEKNRKTNRATSGMTSRSL